MTPHLAEASLRALATTTPDARVAAHLDSCPRCRRLAAAYAALAASSAPGPCPPAEALVAWSEGGAAAQPPDLTAHLASCLHCAVEVEGLGRLASSRRRPPRAPDVATRPSLGHRLAALVRFDMPPRFALVTRGTAGTSSPAMHKAMAAYDSGRYELARRTLAALRRHNAAAPGAAFYEGVCELRLGRPRRAVSALGTAAAASPRDSETRWYLAQALLASRRGSEALAVLAALARRHDVYAERARSLAREVRALLASATAKS